MRPPSPAPASPSRWRVRRPLLAEVQALSVETPNPSPSRTSSGLDSARVAMILAVLTKHCRIDLSRHDVYTATVGGARLVDPSVDLAVAIATASAHIGRAAPADLVAFGEVGLAGEVRKISNLKVRLREAERIGFKRAVVPAGSEGIDDFTGSLKITAVQTIAEAVGCLDSSPPH